MPKVIYKQKVYNVLSTLLKDIQLLTAPRDTEKQPMKVNKKEGLFYLFRK